MVNDKGSLKAVLDSSKETPCFSRLVFAFLAPYGLKWKNIK